MDHRRYIIYTPRDLAVGGGRPAGGGERQSEAAERRRHPRFRVGVLTEIEARGGPAIPGITYNVSRSGALLLTLEPIEAGEEVRIDFISVDNEREVASGRVVHRANLDRGMIWNQKIGIEFIGGGPKFLDSELETLG